MFWTSLVLRNFGSTIRLLVHVLPLDAFYAEPVITDFFHGLTSLAMLNKRILGVVGLHFHSAECMFTCTDRTQEDRCHFMTQDFSIVPCVDFLLEGIWPCGPSAFPSLADQLNASLEKFRPHIGHPHNYC